MSDLIPYNLVVTVYQFQIFVNFLGFSTQNIMSSGKDFNIEIFLASNTQIQNKPVLESLDIETQTNFVINRQLYQSFNYTLKKLHFFMGLDLSSLETPPPKKKTSATKIYLFRIKNSFKQYRRVLVLKFWRFSSSSAVKYKQQWMHFFLVDLAWNTILSLEIQKSRYLLDCAQDSTSSKWSLHVE